MCEQKRVHLTWVKILKCEQFRWQKGWGQRRRWGGWLIQLLIKLNVIVKETTRKMCTCAGWSTTANTNPWCVLFVIEPYVSSHHFFPEKRTKKEHKNNKSNQNEMPFCVCFGSWFTSNTSECENKQKCERSTEEVALYLCLLYIYVISSMYKEVIIKRGGVARKRERERVRECVLLCFGVVQAKIQ